MRLIVQLFDVVVYPVIRHAKNTFAKSELTIDLDALPTIAVRLTLDGEAEANAFFFSLMGHADTTIIGRSLPADFVRQLRRFDTKHTAPRRVWVDALSGAREPLDVVYQSPRAADGSILFLLDPVVDATSDLDRPHTPVVDAGSNNDDVRKHIEKSVEPAAVRVENQFVFATQAMADMFAYESIDALLSTGSAAELVAPHDLQRYEEIRLRREFDDYDPGSFEIDGVAADGRIVSLEVFSRAIIWEGKRAVYSVYRDITGHKNILTRIAESEGVQRQMLDSLPAGILVHDYGKILHVNQAFARLLDFTDAASLLHSGRSVFEFFVDESQIRKRAERRQLGEAEPMSYETEIVGILGTRSYVRIDISPMQWYGTDVVLGSITDISEAVKTKAVLELSEARFRDYAQTAAHWFWETDTEDRIVDISGRLKRVAGQRVSSLIGKRRVEIFGANSGQFLTNFDEYKVAIKNHQPFSETKFWLNLPTGERLAFAISGVAIFDSEGEFTGYRGTTREITKEVELQERIEHTARHDDLTGLVNRRVLHEEIDLAMLDEIGKSNAGHYLCSLDLDGLKVVNDTAGHSVGDELIRHCAMILKQGVADDDVVSRLGGDEFSVLFRNRVLSDVLKTVDTLLQRVSSYRFYSNDNAYTVGFCAGIVQLDDSYGSAEDLLVCADLACYAAKDRGRGVVQVYEATDNELNRRRADMHTANGIKTAIEQDRLVVYAQPIIDLQSASADATHYELLVRMRGVDGSIILPGAFIGAAERYNLARYIDQYVLEHSLSLIDTHWRDGASSAPLVSVNISGESLGSAEFEERVIAAFERFPRVKPDTVCFEITETAAIRNLVVATRFIEHMKKLGCSFALDDFGTGLSSFSYLKDLNVDIIKIDGVFIQDIREDSVNRAVVASICEVARSLDRKVVAECVEDQETVNMLTALGVDYGQGYVWSKPVPFVDVLNTYE